MDYIIHVYDWSLNYGEKLDAVMLTLLEANIKGNITLDGELKRIVINADNLRQANKAIKILKPLTKKSLQ